MLLLIHKILNQKVLLDADFAEMYGIFTKRQYEQTKRNLHWSPAEFLLIEQEWKNLKSQLRPQDREADEPLIMLLLSKK
ncbi:ORF6N domain-containing protein [Algoriphagus resistens]|uniref:ORF6N domain-containing protein n=1 Tax=Algoriphagus resistens TaxID=1750590 RepID=UPI00373FE14E